MSDATARSLDVIHEVARDLRDAYLGTPIRPVRARLPEGDLDAAYAVQERNTEFWLDTGRRLVGRKIGLTSTAVQQQFGVDQPDYGMLVADMICGDAEEIPYRALLQPRVEGESGGATAAEALRPGVHVRASVEKLGSCGFSVLGAKGN